MGDRNQNQQSQAFGDFLDHIILELSMLKIHQHLSFYL